MKNEQGDGHTDTHTQLSTCSDRNESSVRVKNTKNAVLIPNIWTWCMFPLHVFTELMLLLSLALLLLLLLLFSPIRTNVISPVSGYVTFGKWGIQHFQFVDCCWLMLLYCYCWLISTKMEPLTVNMHLHTHPRIVFRHAIQIVIDFRRSRPFSPKSNRICRWMA